MLQNFKEQLTNIICICDTNVCDNMYICINKYNNIKHIVVNEQ